LIIGLPRKALLHTSEKDGEILCPSTGCAINTFLTQSCGFLTKS
jgi:hypothetical protein